MYTGVADPRAGSMRFVKGWGYTAVGLLGLIAVVDLERFWVYGVRRSLLNEILRGPDLSALRKIAANDTHIQENNVAYLLVFLATAAAFIGWTFCAAQHAKQIRPDALRHAPGWAIGGWFVPFLNLVRPPQVINDIWAAPYSPRVGAHTDRRIGPSTPLVGVWWASLLLDNAVARAASIGNSTFAAIRSHALWFMVDSVVDLVAVGLAVALIVALTRRLGAWQPQFAPAMTSFAPPV